MNIVYFLSSTNSSGGASKSFLSMLNGVLQEGVNPIIVVPDKQDLYLLLRKMGLEVLQVPYRVNVYPWKDTFRDYLLYLPRHIGRRALNCFSVYRTYKYLKKRKIDIIHTNVSVIDIGYRVAKKLNIPHIYHIREYIDLDFGLNYYPTKDSFIDQMKESKSYSICITKGIQAHHKLSELKNSRVIYNPIGENKEQISIHIGNYFLFAGRIEPAKGIMDLLQGYLLSETNTPLYIAGGISDPNYYATIQSFIQEKHIEKRITFLGQRSDIALLMQKAKALIVPSRFEAFGRSMSEAMLNNCLVIGLNTGGTKEQFDNGLQLTGNEIGLRYNNTEELSECIKKADFINEKEYTTIIKNANYTVNTLYSIDSHVEQVTKFYNDILKEDTI